VHGDKFLSGPLRTEASRCVAGEESRSESANTPGSLLNSCQAVVGLDWRRDCFVTALLAMTIKEFPFFCDDGEGRFHSNGLLTGVKGILETDLIINRA